MSIEDQLRRELTKRAGWDSDLHTYSFDLTAEQADQLIAALAATQEQRGEPGRVEAAAMAYTMAQLGHDGVTSVSTTPSLAHIRGIKAALAAADAVSSSKSDAPIAGQREGQT